MAKDPILPRPFKRRIRTPWYPDSLLPLIQNTLATLADIEARYEIEREYLQTQAGSDAAATRLAVELEGRYQREREPCIRQLTMLRQQLAAVRGLKDTYLVS